MPTKTPQQSTTPYCVYTIIDGNKLASHRSKPYKGTQGRLWVTAHTLWQKGLDADQRMPILLGDANDCSRILYWGFLEHVLPDRETQTTTFSIDKVREITGVFEPQQLKLKSTGNAIAPNFIRPYAICLTPSFLEA